VTLLFQTLQVFLYSLAVFSLGVLVLKSFFADLADREFPLPPLAVGASCFILGLGLLSAVWLGLSLAGWFSPKLVTALSFLCFFAGGKTTYRVARKALSQAREILRSIYRLPVIWRILALLALIMLVMLGMTSLAGPVVIGSDASAFYMVLPKVTAAAHKLIATTDYVAKHSTFGFVGEMHYAALMSLGAATASKGFSFVTGLALTIMLTALASLAGVGLRGKLIILLVLLSSTAFTSYICDGKVDVFSTAFGVLATYWVMQSGKVLDDKKVLTIAGLALGWSIYAKLSFLVCLAPPLALLVGWRQYQALEPNSLDRTFIKRTFGILLRMGLFALLPVLLLMLKNLILHGEPFAPVFWFSKSWGEWFAVRRYTSGDVVKMLLSYPLVLVAGKYHAQGGTLSPLVLILAPLILLVPRPVNLRKSPLFQISMAALAGLVIWIIAFPSGIGVRFILPILLLFSLPVARGCEYVLTREAKPRWLSAVVWLVLFLLPVFLLYEGYKYYRGPLHFWSKLKNQSYLGRQHLEGPHPVHVALQMVNRLAQPGDRVFIGMVYRYWLDPKLLQCLLNRDEWRSFLEQKTHRAAWAYLYDHGIKFVVMDTLTHTQSIDILGLHGGMAKNAPHWLEVKRIYHHTRWSVYEMRSKDPTRRPRLVCGQKNPPLWQPVPNK
jgi:hypothetical protein